MPIHTVIDLIWRSSAHTLREDDAASGHIPPFCVPYVLRSVPNANLPYFAESLKFTNLVFVVCPYCDRLAMTVVSSQTERQNDAGYRCTMTHTSVFLYRMYSDQYCT